MFLDGAGSAIAASRCRSVFSIGGGGGGGKAPGVGSATCHPQDLLVRAACRTSHSRTARPSRQRSAPAEALPTFLARPRGARMIQEEWNSTALTKRPNVLDVRPGCFLGWWTFSALISCGLGVGAAADPGNWASRKGRIGGLLALRTRTLLADGAAVAGRRERANQAGPSPEFFSPRLSKYSTSAALTSPVA